MKKSLLLLAWVTLFTSSAFASVVKGYDEEKTCELYRIAQADSDGKIKLEPNEVIVSSKEVYGFSFQSMEIDFDSREVLVQVTMNIVMGINRPLLGNKTILSSDHQDFNFLVNQLNRKVSLFEKVCINDNKIIYAKQFEPKSEAIK